MIPYSRQNIDDTDIEAVARVLRSDFLTQGPAVPRFENAVATRVGVRHALAVSNATAALHVACLALGLGPGDVLWTVPNTFVASANCARYCGAEVDFVDIETDTGNLCVEALRLKLGDAKARGRLPKIVVPVHFGGQPTRQQEIWELSQEFGFKVLEDASHAVGASYRGEPVGSCRWSHVAVFSFHAVKIITTGEGGMTLTNDAELARRIDLLRSHGVTRDLPASSFEVSADQAAEPGSWLYEQQALGYNYRMTDIQAALGCTQIERLDAFAERRVYRADRYDRLLADLPVLTPCRVEGAQSSWHLYVIRLPVERVRKGRKHVYDQMRAAGIGVNVHYIPVHTQPYYRALGFRVGDFPGAERYYAEALTLPLFPAMTDEQQQEVVEALSRAVT